MSNPPKPLSAAEVIRKSPPVKSVAGYHDIVNDFSMFTQWMGKQAFACEGINYRPIVDLAYICAVLYGYYSSPPEIGRCLFQTKADSDRLVSALDAITGRMSQLRYTAKSSTSKPQSAYSSLLNMVANHELYDGGHSGDGDDDLVAGLDEDEEGGNEDDNTF